MNASPKIFCAIDTAEIEQARTLISQLAPHDIGIKLGLEFFTTFGPEGIKAAMEGAPDKPLFLDLKFHDIPNTVAAAVKSASDALNPAYLNVHAVGGRAMMSNAKAACAPGTKLIAVTVLTSLSDEDLNDAGVDDAPAAQVERLAKLTKESGLDGVVCSPHEIKTLRSALGPDFALMVPGIRPAGSDANDQKRIMTPSEAIEKGATHLVIGRPITKADNPEEAAQMILAQIQ